MKILVVVARLCHGGAERVGVTLANGLCKKGHEVTVMADLYGPQTYALDGGVKVLNLVPQTNNKLKKWGGAILKVRKELKRNHPDVIIGIMQLCSFVSKMAAMGTGIPVIMTEHDSFERPLSAPLSKVDYFKKFWLNRIYKVVTVLTEADKQVIGGRLKHVVVMPNPLALEPLQQVPLKKHLILAAGRVDDWHYKGFDVLIKAWAKVLKLMPESDWMLYIAGVWEKEASYNYLAQLASELDCANQIKFLGFKNNIKDFYQESSIFVLSSRYEGFGLVLIEAMSQGCAPIACDYKGRQKEILGSEENGITCDPDDVDSLARAICLVVKNDDLRHQMQKHALERSRYYSVEDSVKRWENLIAQVCDKKS